MEKLFQFSRTKFEEERPKEKDENWVRFAFFMAATTSNQKKFQSFSFSRKQTNQKTIQESLKKKKIDESHLKLYFPSDISYHPA